MMTRSAAAAAFGLAMLQSIAGASATDIDFIFTTPQTVEVRCNGPWFRLSPCAYLGAVGPQHFYTAEDNGLDPYGMWSCGVYKYVRRQFCNSELLGKAEFCALTSRVELNWNGSSLTVNQTPRCRLAQARSVLSQNGEDDDTPAQDIDTYSFAGKSGEAVDIKLGRDGSAGSAGDIATLRVRAPNGGLIAERTGAVPLALQGTLPGSVEIVVSRGPGSGNALRGGYELEVAPVSGDIGERKLRPTENVEQ